MTTGNDLSGKITTSFQSATTEVGQLATQMDRLKTSTRNHNTEAKNLATGHGNMAEATKRAKKEAEELGHQFRILSVNGRLLGGTLGGLMRHIGHVGHVATEGGTLLGRFALGVGVASFAIEMYNKVLEVHAEKVKQAYEAQDKFRESIISSQEAVSRAAATAGGKSGAIAGATAKGISEDEVENFADQGKISDDRARTILEGLKAQQLNMTPKSAAAAKQAAIKYLLAGGQSDPAQALMNDPRALGQINVGDAKGAAQSILDFEKTGVPWGHGDDTDKLIDYNQRDPVTKAANESLEDAKRTERGNRRRFASGQAAPEEKAKRIIAAVGTAPGVASAANLARDVELDSLLKQQENAFPNLPGGDFLTGTVQGIAGIFGAGPRAAYRRKLAEQGAVPDAATDVFPVQPGFGGASNGQGKKQLDAYNADDLVGRYRFEYARAYARYASITGFNALTGESNRAAFARADAEFARDNPYRPGVAGTPPKTGPKPIRLHTTTLGQGD